MRQACWQGVSGLILVGWLAEAVLPPGRGLLLELLGWLSLNLVERGDGKGDPSGSPEMDLFIAFSCLPCTTGTLKPRCSQFCVDPLLAPGCLNIYSGYWVPGMR